MRRGRSAAGGLALLWSALVLAHAHLTGSSPADGTQVTAAPTELVLSFSEAAQLTALAIARAGGAKQKLIAPGAGGRRLRRQLARPRRRWTPGPGPDPLHHYPMIDAGWLVLRAAGFILV